MRTPAGTECRYYYEDFHRGRQQRECRLIMASHDSLDWQPDFCARCSVPGILRANGSPHLRLQLTARKQLWISTKLDVVASCALHGHKIDNPYLGCPDCAAELLSGHEAPG